MNPAFSSLIISLLLLGGLLICLEIGFQIGVRRQRELPGTAHEGVGAMEAAIFALLGLLLAFAFAGSMSRLDFRRDLIVKEANAIGTAYLRIDLLPPDSQGPLRHMFREYLDTRLSAYASLPSPEAAEAQFRKSEQMQSQLWAYAVAAARKDPSQDATRLLLPAINEAIDTTTARLVAAKTHMPRLIFFILVGVAMSSGVFAGYAMSKRRARSWLHMLLYSLAVTITTYAVLDLDYPRQGLINLQSADKVMMQLRDSIKE